MRPRSPRGLLAKGPDQIVAARERDDSQGLFGFLRGIKTRFTVRFDEQRDEAAFPIFNTQHLTTAALGDTRDYASQRRALPRGADPRAVSRCLVRHVLGWGASAGTGRSRR